MRHNDQSYIYTKISVRLLMYFNTNIYIYIYICIKIQQQYSEHNYIYNYVHNIVVVKFIMKYTIAH